jgi:hypothetical protein
MELRHDEENPEKWLIGKTLTGRDRNTAPPFERNFAAKLWRCK